MILLKLKFGKYVLVLCVFLAFFAFFGGSAAWAFSGGSGTVSDPWIITTPEELSAVRNHLGAHFRLGNNINLEPFLATVGHSNPWGTSGWMPVGGVGFFAQAFTGSFDGNGYRVTGLWIDRPNTDNVGLFGRTSNATIRNLEVVVASAGVRGLVNVGGLVGHQHGGNIVHSFVTGSVIHGNQDVGGLVGWKNGGDITSSYATNDISGRTVLVPMLDDNGNFVFDDDGNLVLVERPAAAIGGLVGSHTGGNIANSYAAGNVSGGAVIGGLVGEQDGGSIANSYATGNVTGTRGFVGGLVGAFYRGGSIANSYATGIVRGDGNGVGGLVGMLDGGRIENSYATGNVRGNTNVGALVGYAPRGSIASSYRYANILVNGERLTVNMPNGVHGGIRTRDQLTTRATYAGNNWRFNDSVPAGPWHWDDRGFPRLNLGTESFPFRFTGDVVDPPASGGSSGCNAGAGLPVALTLAISAMVLHIKKRSR